MRFSSGHHAMLPARKMCQYPPSKIWGVILPIMVLFLFSLSSLMAQSRIDSLEVRLEETTGEARLDILAELVDALYRNDSEQALFYGREALSLITDDTDIQTGRKVWKGMGQAYIYNRSLDSVFVLIERWRDRAAPEQVPLLEADSLFLRGLIDIRRSSYEAGLSHLNEALAAYEKMGDRVTAADVFENIGFIYRQQGDYDEALASYNRSLTLREEIGDRPGVAAALDNIGVVHWYRASNDEALSFHDRALAIWEELGDRGGFAGTLINIGNIHQEQGTYEEALSNYSRSLDIVEELGQKYQIAALLNNIGNTYAYKGSLDSSLIFYTRSLAISEEIDNKPLIGMLYNNIGETHQEQGTYDEALSFHLRSLAIKEELGNKSGMAYSLNNIGFLYRQQGIYDEALAFYGRSLALREEIGDKQGIAATLNNIGYVHRQQGELDEALSIYGRSLALQEEIGDQRGLATTLNNIGEIHQAQAGYDRALSFYSRSLALQQEIGNAAGVVNSLNSISALYRLQDRFGEAIVYTDRALAMADSIGALPLVRDAHLERTLILEQQGRFAEALDAHRAYKAAHDSLFTSESQSVIAELEQQYKTKEQEQQILLLERNRQIQRLWLFGLIGGLILIALIAFLLYNRYRLKNQAHEALREAHDELKEAHDKLKITQQQLIHAEKMASLGQLTAGIAHEIRNPLNFVNNFAEVNIEIAEELMQAFKNGEDQEIIIADLKQNAQMISQHGKRADGIVRSMMQHATINTGRRELVNINRLVSDHIDLAYHGKRAQLPDLEVEIREELGTGLDRVEVVPQEIGRVLLNLLNNAFDAVRDRNVSDNGVEGPTVAVSTRQVDNMIEIRVQDNGPGIPDEMQGKIFEPFFTTKPQGLGTGLGLSLSYDIITHGHQGTLAVESDEGKGATFIITLPAVSN